MSGERACFAGVDIGSAFIKALLVSRQKILASAMRPSGGRYRETAQGVLEAALARAGLSREQLAGMVVTGVGAESAPGRSVSIFPAGRGCVSAFLRPP
jgi:activator of 2-hydroxyglutaryl-CoA dehydratase